MMVVVIISERNKSTWVDTGRQRWETKIDTRRRDGDYTCLAKGKHRPRTIV
jgi:hypothetical protein